MSTLSLTTEQDLASSQSQFFTATALTEVDASTSAAQPPPSESPDAGDPTEFPIDCLPPALAEMVSSVAQVLRVPIALPGICALGAVSTAIGKGVLIETLPSQTTTGNIYILGSATSGTGKSIAFGHLLRPFFDEANRMAAAWKVTELPKLLAEKVMLDWDLKQLKSSVKSASNRAELMAQVVDHQAAVQRVEESLDGPVYTVDDCTVEKLALLLQTNGETMASLSPDAGSIVNNVLGRYNKTKRTDEDIYLKAFSGDPVQVARMGRAPVALAKPILTCLWLTQPDKLQSLMASDALRDGGLLPRFLICNTGAEPQLIQDDAPTINAWATERYESLIVGLFRRYLRNEQAMKIPVEQEARQIIITYTNDVIGKLRTELADVASFAARWGEQAWKLGLILHCARYGEGAHEEPVSGVTARSAVRFARWFSDQQLQALVAIREKAVGDQQAQILSLLLQKPEGISSRDVQRKRITQTAGTALSLLQSMVEDGTLCVVEVSPPGGGPATRVYRLNSRRRDT